MVCGVTFNRHRPFSEEEEKRRNSVNVNDGSVNIFAVFVETRREDCVEIGLINHSSCDFASDLARDSS